MPNSGKCPVCNYIYSNMITHLCSSEDDDHKKYLVNLNIELDPLILNTDLYAFEIEEEIAERGFFINKNYIYMRTKEIEPNRKSRVLSSRRMGENNPVFKHGVIEKIRSTVKDRWNQGVYKDRINGMLNITKEKHHRYKKEKHTPQALAQRFYSDFLSNFEDISTCRRCNSSNNINIHHIDEEQENFLISNLEPLCVPCHMEFHYTTRKQPFVTISKTATFAAAHMLPHYVGKCENWHGHEWKIEVSIRKRIDPATMMVMDFKELKNIMSTYIVNILDHNCINDIIAIPTAENILIWCWEQLMFKGHIKGIKEIRLWETADSSASITKEGMLSVFKKKIG